MLLLLLPVVLVSKDAVVPLVVVGVINSGPELPLATNGACRGIAGEVFLLILSIPRWYVATWESYHKLLSPI